MDPDALRSLERRGLLPMAWHGGPVGLDRRLGVDYRRRYRGTLLGVAIGDALGRPAEGRSPERIRERFGVLRDFVPWSGWTGGPRGTITDDTQMTMCLAESIMAHGGIDPADLATRFAGWLDHGRGKGSTCTHACLRLRDGVPWWEAGIESAGNGAAMRAAPIGLAHPRSPAAIRRDGTLSAVITHADPMAAASVVAVGYVVAHLLHLPAGALRIEALSAGLREILDDLPDPGAVERKPGSTAKVRLVDRLAEVPDLLDSRPEEAFAYLYNGAFVLESLPAALWCFLQAPEDPEMVVVVAANGGHDADTVAAMAGGFAGAYHGEDAWPQRWLNDLEYAAEIRDLADGLLAVGDPDGAGPLQPGPSAPTVNAR